MSKTRWILIQDGFLYNLADVFTSFPWSQKSSITNSTMESYAKLMKYEKNI
jgi:hypothetical protein